MANYSELIDTINGQIKANGNQEITGPVLNAVLQAMVSALGEGYQYMGVATPDTNPGTPDGRVFYLAYYPGTYSNLGNVILPGDTVFVLYSSESGWSYYDTGIVSYFGALKAFVGGQNTKLGYIRNTDGKLTQHERDAFWTFEAPIPEGATAINLSLANWYGGDLVAIVACFDGNHRYLGALLTGETALTHGDYVNEHFSLLPNTSFVTFTTREKASLTFNIPGLSNSDLHEAAVENERIKNAENAIFSKDWEFTDAVGVVSYKAISMTGESDVMHLNFAKKKEKNSCIIDCVIEDIISSGSPLGSMRVGFGNLRYNYCITITKNSNQIVLWFFTPDGFISSKMLTGDDDNAFVPGDRITLFRSGTYLQYFRNGNLVASGSMASCGYLSEMAPVLAFRNYGSRWTPCKIVTKIRHHPYMHVSFDDTIGILQEITTNAESMTSLWDDDYFAWLKSMHGTYGAVFSFYCFYENGTFNLSQVTSKFKADFTAASDWLKFGFHAKNDKSNYNTVSAETLVADYKQVYAAIVAFAGYASIDNIPRIHTYAATKEALLTLQSTSGMLGLLTADDTRENNCALSAAEREIVTSCDDYFAFDRNLYYLRTERRMDEDMTATDIETKLAALDANLDNREIYIMFCHEQKMLKGNGKTIVEACLAWAAKRGLKFDYPQNNTY